jgi:foldase protein PrsA
MSKLRYGAPFALVLLASGLALGCGGAGASGPGASPASTDAVVARVNGHEVRKSAVVAAQGQASLEQGSQTYAQARDQVIGEELVREEAERLGVSVSAAEIDARVAELRAAAGGADALGIALDNVGLTPDQFRQRVAVTLLSARVGSAKSPGTATIAQAKTFYNANRSLFSSGAAVDLGDINVRTEGMAKSVLKRLAGGQPFEKAAVQFAHDPQEGRVGWVLVSAMPAELADGVAGLKVGQVSAPVSALGGWHVLKVFNRRAARTLSFEQARSEIVTELTRRQRLAALDAWLKKVRPAAEVQLLP